MDQQQERILADLRGVLDGEVHCDDLFLQMYSGDASVYEYRPLAVVRPRNLDDVVAVTQYAAENRLPIHPRGAGTGLAGESLGAGIVIDFSHSMRRVLEVGEDSVRVQPGVVLAQLNRHLAAIGRMFGPDPATRSVTTVGSVVALDGAGSHWPRYGSARRHIRSMQAVLADGQVIEASQHKLSDAAPESTLSQLVDRLARLIRREQSCLDKHWPRAAVNRSGYAIRDVLQEDQLDLARLLVGSEGTLAMFSEVTLSTVPIAPERGLTMLFFERLELAARGALEAAKLQPATCDLMDRRLLSIARETDPVFDRLIPRQAEAVLLVEQDGQSHQEVRERMEELVRRLQRQSQLAFHTRSTLQRDERDQYWRLARRVVPRLYRLKGSIRPLPFVEDMAVPPESLPDFLVTLQNVLKSHQVTATLFAHALQGQLHVRPFLDLGNSSDVGKMRELATDLYQEVLAVGGTVSGEHGDGLSRTWFLRRQFGPAYEVLQEVKRIFDPHNLLNPGKIVAEAPHPLTQSLRPVPPETSDALTPILHWGEGELGFTTRLCNGCGRCRTQSPDERMCPIFRFAPREEASPRAKANVLRGFLTGQLDPELLTSDETRELADLCVNCHQCRLECPAGVDIPKLMLELKSQHAQANGMRLQQWIVSHLESLSSLGSRFATVANWMLRSRQMRWLLERLTGIAQGRKLPRLAPRSFVRMAHRMRLGRLSREGGRKVVYFVDIYANWHDTQLGAALVHVLRHNGVGVHVPSTPLVSGMAAASQGHLDRVRHLAESNVKLLADAVRQGYEVVATEPAAAACLRHEYVSILDDEDSRLVAAHTHDACDYLWHMHLVGDLRLDFKPVSAQIGYHQPCHLRGLESGSPGEQLLKLIPGLQVRRLDHGCSGMAGAFGLLRKNYRNSLRAGWQLISAVRDPLVQFAATECSACKLQMEQGTTKPTIHPLKLLSLAYGLQPEIEQLLTARGEELIVT